MDARDFQIEWAPVRVYESEYVALRAPDGHLVELSAIDEVRDGVWQMHVVCDRSVTDV